MNVPFVRAVLVALALAVLPAAAVAAADGPAAPHAAKVPVTSATLSPQILQSLLQTHPQTPLQQHAPWLTHIFAGLFIIFAVALVVLLAFQTTKQEGLSGTLGGRVESAYRPRLGFDQQLARLTTFVAVGFGVMATIVSLSGI